MTSFSRRLALSLPLFTALACRSPEKSDDAALKGQRSKASQVRIGYQKAGVLALVKWRGVLEKDLTPRGVSVQWAEFPSGPAIVEALNGQQLDLGFVGEAPPVFGQAASPNLVYLAAEPPAPHSEALLVKKGSGVRNLEDLKGKTVALNKGSNVHYLLVQALKRANVRYEDVRVVFLAPADGRAAFENGNVDAWAIWDPYLASAQETLGARILADAEGLAANHLFYVGRRDFVEREADLCHLIMGQVESTDVWVRSHLTETAGYLSEALGVEKRAMQLSLERATWGVLPIDDQIVASQQKIANAFLELGLLAKPIRISEAVPQLARGRLAKSE